MQLPASARSGGRLLHGIRPLHPTHRTRLTWSNSKMDHVNNVPCPLYFRAGSDIERVTADGHGQRPYKPPDLQFHNYGSAGRVRPA